MLFQGHGTASIPWGPGRHCPITLAPCSAGSCHPDPDWLLAAPPGCLPRCGWALNRSIIPCWGLGPWHLHPVWLSRAGGGLLPPSATCGGSAAGTVPPRWLCGAAKPQKCTLNKPAPLNEDSSCPIKSEVSLSSGTGAGGPGRDRAPDQRTKGAAVCLRGTSTGPLPCMGACHLPLCSPWRGQQRGKAPGKHEMSPWCLAGSIPWLLLTMLPPLGDHGATGMGLWGCGGSDRCSCWGQEG